MSSKQQFERALPGGSSTPAQAPRPGAAVKRAAPAPVLPAGWAPLTLEQQAAVLEACDRAPHALLLRVSTISPSMEYRVYRLDASWAGLCVASMCDVAGDGAANNRELLALGSSEPDVVTVVVSRVNAEMRPAVAPGRPKPVFPAILSEDPRRV